MTINEVQTKIVSCTMVGSRAARKEGHNISQTLALGLVLLFRLKISQGFVTPTQLWCQL